MNSTHPIIDVSTWPREDIEQMGSKVKFWCRDPQNKDLHLFKFGRQHSGEDWSEAIAALVAQDLGIPHALINLAVCDGRRGSLSRNFVDEGQGCQLVHGNEILFDIDPNYPKGGPNFRVQVDPIHWAPKQHSFATPVQVRLTRTRCPLAPTRAVR